MIASAWSRTRRFTGIGDQAIDREPNRSVAAVDLSGDRHLHGRSGARLRLLRLHLDRPAEPAHPAQRAVGVSGRQPADRHHARDANPAPARAGAAGPRDRLHAPSRRPPLRPRRRPALPQVDRRPGAGLLRAGHGRLHQASLPYAFQEGTEHWPAGFVPKLQFIADRAGSAVRGPRPADPADPAGARAVQVLGFRVGDLAYCTDVNRIPEESWGLLEGLDILSSTPFGTSRIRPISR